MQWNATYSESVHSFANNINTHEGGSHLSGFRAALTRTMNAYARASGALKEKDENLLGEDMVEGLAAIISVKLREPQFEGQTKTKLGNPSIKGVVETAMNSMLSRVPRGAPERREGDRHEGRRGRPRAAGRPQGARPDAAQDRARLDAPPGQARRLLDHGPGAVRAVPRRGQLAPAALPSTRGTASSRRSSRCAARSSTSRRRGSQGALEPGDPEHDHGDRRQHRRGLRPGLRALPQDRRDDGRGRRRRAHPHADPDVLLPPHARADRARASSTSRSRRSTASRSGATSAT